MAHVVLLHSAFGLDAGVHAWAGRLRAEGHTVMTPDLYDGEVFSDLDEAVAKADAVGMEEWAARAAEVIGPETPGRVYAGFSLGAGIAQILALDDPSVGGLVLLHTVIGPHWLDHAAWPTGLRAQLHYAAGDPWVEATDVAEFAAFASPGALETFVYPGDVHLFGFEDSPDYDAASAELMWRRVRDFVAEL